MRVEQGKPFLTQERRSLSTSVRAPSRTVSSTPYWHARELLADGRGILVPFGDATAIGSKVAGLLIYDARRQVLRKRALRAADR